MNKELINKCKKYDFKTLLESKGYAYFTKGKYNLNIIGVRAKGNKCTNTFDDAIVLIYNDELDKTIRYVFPATTDPGITELKHPSNVKGCAILVPGQYRGCYQLGKHKGKYEALVQRKPVKVYRDNNHDETYDYNPISIDEGVFGINIHKAGLESTVINNWSAGCQVVASASNLVILVAVAKKQIAYTGCKSFTYTLINEEDM